MSLGALLFSCPQQSQVGLRSHLIRLPAKYKPLSLQTANFILLQRSTGTELKSAMSKTKTFFK